MDHLKEIEMLKRLTVAEYYYTYGAVIDCLPNWEITTFNNNSFDGLTLLAPGTTPQDFDYEDESTTLIWDLIPARTTKELIETRR